MKSFSRLCLLALLPFFLTACGPGDSSGGGTANEAPVILPDGTLHLILRGDDRMRFDKLVLRTKAGQKVRLELKHVGKAPKSAMGHNFVLLKSGVNHGEFARKAALAISTEFIPAEFKDDVLAHTRMIGGGETDTVEFTVAEKGTYVYLCSFPGHYGTMRGQFIVE